VSGDIRDPEAYEFEPEPYALVTDLVTGREGIVLGAGDEQALVRFPLIGDLWVPYGELLPGGDIVGA
jgi:hypothetical protein